MNTALVRRVHNATNVLHSFIYFAPEAEEHFTGAGLESGRMCYFAGRSAAMGAVGPGVVTATFYNFSPGPIRRCIPRAWSLASPADVIAARFAAVDAALPRLLGADVTGSAGLARLADLVREAASVCTAEGRPLYAGHAEHPLGHRAGLPGRVRPGQQGLDGRGVGGGQREPGGPRPAHCGWRAERGRPGAAGQGRGGDRHAGHRAVAAPRRRADRGGHQRGPPGSLWPPPTPRPSSPGWPGRTRPGSPARWPSG
jgi:hypothetical protein